METGQVKGHTLVNARTFCIERYGDAGWQRVREALSPATLEVAESAVREGWYDITVYTELLDAIWRTLGDGSFDTMVALGHFAAERDLTTVMRLFMRVVRPKWLLRGYAQLWSSYQTTGTWRVESEGPRRLRAWLTGWGSPSEAACVSVAAFIERFLQLVGGHNARVTRPQCCSRGDPVCEYDVEWDAAPSRLR